MSLASLLAVLATSALLVGTAQAASPYAASSILGGVSWDQTSKVRYASGSDIWDSMWASDGNVYGFWGDGFGFLSGSKKFIGLSKLVGSSPSSLTGSDPYYGTTWSNPPPCAQQPTLGGKPHGVVAFASSLMYLFHSTQDLCTNNTWLAKSTNNGVAWTDHVSSQQWPDASGFTPSSILQTGQAQAGALVPINGTTPYIFIYGGKTTDPAGSGKQYVARVPASPTNAIETLSNWSYYSGTDASGNPTWASASTSSVPVFTDPDHAQTMVVAFNKAIGRYIAYDDHGSACGGFPCERQVALYDAASPWGPWTNFDYEDNFNNTGCGSSCLGSMEAVGWSMIQKWFSSDGLTIWPAYNSIGVWDSLNFIKGTLSLASGSTIKSIATLTGTPAVVDKLSTSDPGNLEYIDRTYRLTSIPAAYVGMELIRLANNDKANAASNYLTFTITAAQNVCVGWDSLNAIPSWLSTWTKTTNSLVGNVTFNVYRKAFAAGTVTLGGPNTVDNYIPFVGC
jgi:hypothetical protein